MNTWLSTDQLPTLRFGMGFMTLNRQLVNLEPKLAEIFSFWDTTAVSLGKTMGKTRRESPWKTSKGRSDTLGFSISESITLKFTSIFGLKNLVTCFLVYGEISKCAFRRKLPKKLGFLCPYWFSGAQSSQLRQFLASLKSPTTTRPRHYFWASPQHQDASAMCVYTTRAVA